MDNNPTPNHQKQCEEMTWKGVTATLTIDWENKTYDMQIGDAPQEEKVSEEKLYSLRGGTPEGYDKLNASLNVVEKQIGGALRRLQVQELKDAEGEETIWPDRPKIQQCCDKCQAVGFAENDTWYGGGNFTSECGNLDCPCHSSKEEKQPITISPNTDRKVPKAISTPTPSGEKITLKQAREIAQGVFAEREKEWKEYAAPENDSWEEEFDSKYALNWENMWALKTFIKQFFAAKKKEWEEAAHARGKREGKREVMEMTRGAMDAKKPHE